MEWIKLIWDFRGPHAEGTAKHHAIHLKEFSVKEGIDTRGYGHEKENDSHYIAFLTIQKENMILVRDALKPTRAVYAENQ